jgi:hypothetical protein
VLPAGDAPVLVPVASAPHGLHRVLEQVEQPDDEVGQLFQSSVLLGELFEYGVVIGSSPPCSRCCRGRRPIGSGPVGQLPRVYEPPSLCARLLQERRPEPLPPPREPRLRTRSQASCAGVANASDSTGGRGRGPRPRVLGPDTRTPTDGARTPRSSACRAAGAGIAADFGA